MSTSENTPEWKKDPALQERLNEAKAETYARCGWVLADFADRPEPLKVRVDLKKNPEARR